METDFDADTGADLIELGVPYSDPLADGPLIHAAGTTALRAGARLDGVLALCERVSARVPVLPFGLAEARRHAELWAHLAREGTMIGAHDLLIGATALAHGHSLATLNTKEFGRVAGLRLINLERFIP